MSGYARKDASTDSAIRGRANPTASQNTYSVIPGPRALGSALCAVRAQAPRAEPGIHNHRSSGCERRASNCRLGLWFPGSSASRWNRLADAPEWRRSLWRSTT